MNRKKKSTLFLTQAAVIAALYTALTYISNSLGLAYNSVQFRLSEILTVLPVFSPAAIPGLTLGCIISNISSPFGVIDIVCGSFATLLAAVISYAARNVTVKKIPFISILAPVLCNAIIIGLEIWYLEGRAPEIFFISVCQVGLGEAIMCIAVGIPFIQSVKRTRLFSM